MKIKSFFAKHLCFVIVGSSSKMSEREVNEVKNVVRHGKQYFVEGEYEVEDCWKTVEDVIAKMIPWHPIEINGYFIYVEQKSSAPSFEQAFHNILESKGTKVPSGGN